MATVFSGEAKFAPQIQACIQRGVRIPPALVEVTTDFEASRLGTYYNSIRPGSLAVIGFQVVNLRAAIKNQQVTDPDAICRAALDIDNDLQAWASLQSHRRYLELDIIDCSTDTSFNGKRHIYSTVWGAQVWNNWRSLGILTNRIILDYVDEQSFEDELLKRMMRSNSLSVIRNLSTDICISTLNLSGSPRKCCFA